MDGLLETARSTQEAFGDMNRDNFDLQRPAQLLELTDGQPAVLREHTGVRALEPLLELGDRSGLVRPGHGRSFRGGLPVVPTPNTRNAPAQTRGA